MFERLLSPEPKFRYFSDPVFVDFPYHKLAKGPFVEPPAEWAVAFDIDGDVKSAFVPSFSVDEDSGTVRAALVGKIDDRVLVRLAITQLGSATFYVSEERLVDLVPALADMD